MYWKLGRAINRSKVAAALLFNSFGVSAKKKFTNQKDVKTFNEECETLKAQEEVIIEETSEFDDQDSISLNSEISSISSDTHGGFVSQLLGYE